MSLRSFCSFAAVSGLFLLGAVLTAACTSEDMGDLGKASMRSAGGLSESRLPQGLVGDTPAPTGARPGDKSLQAGWLKRAKGADKPPTYGDHVSF